MEKQQYQRKNPTKYKIIIYVVTTLLMVFWFFDAQRTAQERVMEDVNKLETKKPTPPHKESH